MTKHTDNKYARVKNASLVLAVAIMAVAAAALTACSKPAQEPATQTQTQPAQTQTDSSQAADQGQADATASDQAAQTQPAEESGPTSKDVKELKIKDVKKGSGPAAKSGDSVTVNYTGWLANGTKFDSSVGKQPFTFTIDAGQVIKGWDKGVAGMKVGGKRRLIIPSDLGYGPQGYPPVIPQNATLIFDVEMLKIN